MRIRQALRYRAGLLVFLLLSGSCGDSALREANERAAIALEEGRPAEAVRILKSFGSRVQKSPTVLVNLGRAYLELGEVDKSLLELRQAGTLVRRDDPVLLLLARIFLSYSELDEVDQILERCGPALRGKADYHLLLGHLLLDVGSDREEIAAEFQEALRLDPANREAAESLLLLIQDMTDPAAVEATLAELPDQVARSASAQLLLGEIRAGVGQWNEAMRIARQLISSRTENVYAWVLLAQAREALGQMRAAEVAFRTAVRRSGSAPDTVIEYARFLMDQKRDGEALRFLAAAEQKQASLPLVERLPALHNLLAAIYARRGQMLQAEQQLVLSLDVDPDQPETRRLLDAITDIHKAGFDTNGSTREEPAEKNSLAP